MSTNKNTKVRKEINYYNILGLHPNGVNKSHENYTLLLNKYLKNITLKDIKMAYRKMSKIYHPDKNNGDDTKFKLLSEAYKVLTNDVLRSNYDTISEYGASFDRNTNLYDFDFSNDSVEKDNFNRNSESFKDKELINILIELEEFQETIKYDRYVSCKVCDSTGVNPDFIDDFECDFCDGVGEDNKGHKCSYCKGKGQLNLGFEKCLTCKGDKVVHKLSEVKIKKEDFNDGKMVIEYKGNTSKVYNGKVGNLYITLK